jgi:large subunit ribosomal protein L5
MVKEKNNYKPRLLIKYNEVVQKYLADQLDIKNNMRIPKIKKIVLNMGIGDAKEHKKSLTSGIEELTTIAGQKAVVTNSKKAISNFNIREGDPVGIRVTLRSNKMYEFVDRLISVASPKIRDFRGLSAKGFDGRGNYNFGVNEQIIFPEIDYDKINNIRGLNISIVTTGKTDEEAYELLIAMGLPIRQKKKEIEVDAEDTADETQIDEVEMASDVEDNKEETSEEGKEISEEKPVKADTEEVKAGEEAVTEDTPEEMQDEDKADESPLDEVETASDASSLLSSTPDAVSTSSNGDSSALSSSCISSGVSSVTASSPALTSSVSALTGFSSEISFPSSDVSSLLSSTSDAISTSSICVSSAVSSASTSISFFF